MTEQLSTEGRGGSIETRFERLQLDLEALRADLVRLKNGIALLASSVAASNSVFDALGIPVPRSHFDRRTREARSR